MIHYSGQVSHRWRRRRAAQEARAAGRGPGAGCDADNRLIAAARFHGSAAPEPCPVCGSAQLRRVCWIYGSRLGARDGTASDPAEIARLAAAHGELSVHTVEVCPACRWNHLLETATASADGEEEGPVVTGAGPASAGGEEEGPVDTTLTAGAAGTADSADTADTEDTAEPGRAVTGETD